MSDAKVKFETLDFGTAVSGKEERFGFKCPKHPTNRCEGLLIRGPDEKPRPSWVWDGNRDAPTFSPSINCQTCPGKWHGYIERGRCVSQSKTDEPEPR
jgi:hypothetical protein